MLTGVVAELKFGETELLLHAEKFAWHSASRSLFVADLHLGKETSFQRAGRPVPLGATDEALDRISRFVSHYLPDQVVVLGDMVHAADSFAEGFREKIKEFWQRQQTVSPKSKWVLVEGNHDRRAKRELINWPITIVQPPWSIGDLICIHDPDEKRELVQSNSERLILAGHLHPSFRMPDNGERLCCFALRQNVLIFPAFNQFTGRRIIDGSSVSTVFVIRENQLARIDL